MRIFLFFFSFSFSFSVSILPGQAWDSCGHEIIAALAEQKMNPKARAAIEAAAREMSGPTFGNSGPYDAVTLACWMDDIKSFHPQMAYQGWFKSWHYINLGIQAGDPLPNFVPGQDNEIQGNVVQALKRVEVVLRGGTDPYIRTRAMACAMALHLVGDIHQPLHVATVYYRGRDGRLLHDNGGNRVEVVNGPSDEERYNLHYFWDAAWRASYDSATGKIVLDSTYDDRLGGHDARQVELIAEQLSTVAPPVKIGTSLDYEQWAREGNQIARDIVYHHVLYERANAVRISSRYVEEANPLARQRMILAAYRLALLFNTSVGAETPSPVPPAYPAGPSSPDF